MQVGPVPLFVNYLEECPFLPGMSLRFLLFDVELFVPVDCFRGHIFNSDIIVNNAVALPLALLLPGLLPCPAIAQG